MESEEILKQQQQQHFPASSLAELAEWQKSKEPTPVLIGGKTEQEWLYIFAGDIMSVMVRDLSIQDAAEASVKAAKNLLTELKKEVI